MIPGVMIKFLERASVAIASTRDASLAPAVHLLCGWRVREDRASVACLFPAGFTPGLVESLEDNGHLAVAAEVIGPHDCYQFKGSYGGSLEVTAADRQVHRDCRARFAEAVSKHTGSRFPASSFERAYGEPAMVVILNVQEVYVQTPGPGAGARLFPPPEEGW